MQSPVAELQSVTISRFCLCKIHRSTPLSNVLFINRQWKSPATKYPITNLEAKINFVRSLYQSRSGILIVLVFGAVAAWGSTGLDQEDFYDEVSYYSYLSSIATDLDLDLSNDFLYQRIGFSDWKGLAFDHTLTGAVDNKFSIGPALLWLPIFIPFHLGLTALSSIFPGVPADGFSLPYRILVIAGTYSITLYSLIRIHRWLRNHHPPWVALSTVLVSIFGTFWIYYVVAQPLYAHALSIALSLLLVMEWLRNIEQVEFEASNTLIFLSLLVVLVRWQNVLLVAALFVYTAIRVAEPSLSRLQALISPRLLRWPLLALLGFVPQIMVWVFQNGTLFTPPQGSDFLRFDSLKVLPLLFSSWHGLFSTHPVFLVGLAGLLWNAIRRKPLGVAFILAFIPMTVLNSAVDDWWAGGSFGMRRYDSLLPFFILGIADTLVLVKKSWVKAAVILGLGILVISNLLLMSLFSQLYIQTGLPLMRQTGLLISSFDSVQDLGRVLMPVRSPLGTVLRGGTSLVRAVLLWLPILISLALIGLWIGRRGINKSGKFPIGSGSIYVGVVTFWLVLVAVSIMRTSRTELGTLSLAKSFFYMGRFDQSLALLDRVTNSGFCDARLVEHEIRTLIQDSEGQRAAAETILDKCGSIGWYHLATFATGSGSREISIRDQAGEMLERYAPWHAHTSGIHLALARSELGQGKTEGAEAQYLKAIGFNPLNSSARLESAGLSRAKGDLQTAQSRLAQPHGFSRAFGLAVLSEIYAFQNEFDEARNLLEQARTFAGGDSVIKIEIGNAAIRQRQDSAAAESMNAAIASRPSFGLGHWYPWGELMLGDAWLGRWATEGSNMNDASCRTAQGHQRFVSNAYHKYVLLSTASALLTLEQAKNDRSLIRDGIGLIRDFIHVERSSLHERTELVTSLIESGNLDEAISLMRATTTYYHPRAGLSELPSFETLVAESEKEVGQRLRRLSDVSEILDRLEVQITTDEFSESAGLNFADPELRRSALRDVLIDLIPYEYWWTPRGTGRVSISLIKAEACSGRQREALAWAIDTFGLRALSSDVVVISAQLGAFRDLETEIRELRRVTSLEPGNFWALFELGRALRESGQHQEAIKILQQANSLAPGFANTYFELSLTYDELGYARTAEFLSRQAQEIEPGWHSLYANPLQ